MRAADVHVWCCRGAEVDAATLDDSVARLDADERRRLDGLHSPEVRREFLLSRLLLRGALAAHLQTEPGALRFARDANGKPQLAGPFAHWHFNLSHGGDWVALALSSVGPVGIDVETHARRNNLRGIARRFFAAAEQAALDRLDDDGEWLQGFFATWTLKEAHAKALGCGLSKILSCSSFVAGAASRDLPGTVELQLSGIAASTLPVALRLYRPALDTSLALSQLGATEIDVALYRWLPGANGVALSSYFALAPSAAGSWRPSDPTSARPRA